MRIPDKPEPMEALKARFPAVLSRVWNVDAGDVDGEKRPGQCTENVFDTASGLRFIVSVDQYAAVNDNKPHLHVSVSSFRGGSAVEQEIMACKGFRRRRDAFSRAARTAFAEISGIKLPARAQS